MKLKLIVIGGKKAGMEIPISMPKCVIGRGDDCHIRPQSSLISRKHCIISVDSGSVAIEDCGSANGTLVNGEKVQRRELRNGDRIKIGTLELEVQLTAEAAIYALQEEQSHSRSNNVGVHRNGVRSAASHPVAPAAIPDGEVDLLGWLDGKSSGPKSALPITKATTLPRTNATATQNWQEKALQPRSVAQVGRLRAAAHFHPQTLSGDGKLLAGCEEVTALSLNKHETEWDGTDLLLLAALGLLLVVILSWLFPMSWPEAGKDSRGWLTWCLQTWWHTWWLRWGTVVILVAGLLKVFRIRARSEQGAKT